MSNPKSSVNQEPSVSTPNPWVNQSVSNSFSDCFDQKTDKDGLPNCSTEVLNAYQQTTVFKQLKVLENMHKVSKDISKVKMEKHNVLCAGPASNFLQKFKKNQDMVKESIHMLETLMKNSTSIENALKQPYEGLGMKIETERQHEIRDLFCRIGDDMNKLKKECDMINWHTNNNAYNRDDFSYLQKFPNPTQKFEEELNALERRLSSLQLEINNGLMINNDKENKISLCQMAVSS